jgi:hypothetical protein
MISWMPGCAPKGVHPGHPVFHSSEFIRPSCAKPLSSSTGLNLVSLAWASTRRAQPLPNPLRAGPLNNQRRVLVLRGAIIQPTSLNIIKDFTIVDAPLVPSQQKPSSCFIMSFRLAGVPNLGLLCAIFCLQGSHVQSGFWTKVIGLCFNFFLVFTFRCSRFPHIRWVQLK